MKNKHRMVIEVDKDQCLRLRGKLLREHGQTISNWVRQKIAAELGESERLTRYLQNGSGR